MLENGGEIPGGGWRMGYDKWRDRGTGDRRMTAGESSGLADNGRSDFRGMAGIGG